MPTYKYPVYIALATILGFSLAEVEITGVNDLSVPTPSRFDVLRNKAFPSLFSARVDLNFASDTYEISTLLLASNDEEGIPFSVSYTSPIDQFGDIGEFIIKAGEDEAVPVSEFEVDDDGWQMSFRPLEYNENVPSLAMKFIAVSPEGLHYSNNPLIPCSRGRGGGVSCTISTVPLRSAGERLGGDELLEEEVIQEDDETRE